MRKVLNALVLAVAGAWCVQAEQVSYLEPVFDATGAVTGYETKSAECTKLPDSRESHILMRGWYYVDTVSSIKKTLLAVGDVHLILKDNARLNVNTNRESHCGICVEGNSSVTIYAQSAGNFAGKLFASGGSGAAAIGSGSEQGAACGKITINGGHIIAGGGENGSGIGGGKGGNAINGITINGGIVMASGGDNGAGIGGGRCGSGKEITINGGRVTAIGGDNGAGVGSGECELNDGHGGSDITINGGKVTAIGGDNGAGIGGGLQSPGYRIKINGGEVNATGGSYAAGIGGGYKRDGYYIYVSSGTVEATGGSCGAGIGGGRLGDGSNIGITGGTVTASSAVYDGLSDNGAGAGIGGGYGGEGHDIAISGGVVAAKGWEGGAGIGGGDEKGAHGITISGGAVTASGSQGGAGIGGGTRGSAYNITISGGTVTATGSYQEAIAGYYTAIEYEGGAGIGSSTRQNASNIVITGGEVTAIGLKYGAGIGSGGFGGDAIGLTISGGVVKATGGNEGGAGIGGGLYCSAKDIKVTGGLTYVIGGAGAADIGQGSGGSQTGMVFEGGTVAPMPNQTNDGSTGIGGGTVTVTGGNVGLQMLEPEKVVNKNAVRLYQVIVPGISAGREFLEIVGLDYGVKDICEANGQIVVWLPAATTSHTFYVGTKKYTVTVDGTKQSYVAECTSNMSVPYLDYDEEKDAFVEKWVDCPTAVTSMDESWGASGMTTWYIAESSNVRIDNTVKILGHVNLILMNSCSLTVNGGYKNTPAAERCGAAILQSDQDSSFTIYAQTSEAGLRGRLIATGAKTGAGIGGGNPDGTGSEGCNITINGGYVQATGGDCGGAGIGGAQDYSGHDITINGGKVIATGGTRGGAGIGGGGASTDDANNTHGHGRKIIIRGGYVTATGGAAATESSTGGGSGFCFINDEPAWGVGADIGGGGAYQKAYSMGIALLLIKYGFWMVPYRSVSWSASGVFFVLNKIIALQEAYIGGGNCSDVTISGGTVDAPMIAGQTTDGLRITGGSVRLILFGQHPVNALGEPLYLTPLTPPESVEPGGIDIDIEGYGVRDMKLMEDYEAVFPWLPKGHHDLTYGGDIYRLSVYDHYECDLKKIGADIDVTVDGENVRSDMNVEGCTVLSGDHEVLTIKSGVRHVISGAETKGRLRIVLQGGADVVISNLTLTVDEQSKGFAPITCVSGENRIQLGGRFNRLSSRYITEEYGRFVYNSGTGCGISVQPDASLTLYGEGALTAIAGDRAAAIGGSASQGCGAITVAGGEIIVLSDEKSAGIGTGHSGGDCPGVTVSNGYVRALGGYVGIGSGEGGVVVPVTLVDGTLAMETIGNKTATVEGPNHSDGVAETIAKSSGVTIDGGNFAGSVVFAGLPRKVAMNSKKQVVYQLPIAIDVGQPDGEVVTNLSVYVEGYGLTDIRSINGYVSLWLPKDAVIRKVGPDGKPLDLIGVKVNGYDLSWGTGDGWAYDSEAHVLALSDNLTYAISGVDDRPCYLSVDVLTNATLQLEALNLVASPAADGAVRVAANRTAVLAGAGTNHLDAVSLEDGASVRIDSGYLDSGSIGWRTSGGDGAIIIQGGTVETKVLGANGTNIVIAGGSVKAGRYSSQPTATNGTTQLYDTPISYLGNWAAEVRNLDGYGTTDIYPTSDGFIHFWLPASDDYLTFTVGGTEKYATVDAEEGCGRERLLVPAVGEPWTAYSQAEADRIAKQALVLRPNEDVKAQVSARAYGDYFNVSAKPTAKVNIYTLEVGLSDETTNALQKAFAAALPTLVETITNDAPTTTVQMLPGLYYGLAGATELSDLKSAAVPKDGWVLGDGNARSVAGRKPDGVSDKAFYQLRVEIEP